MATKTRKCEVVLTTYEIKLTPTEFKRFLELDHYKTVMPALKRTEIDESSVDCDEHFPNTVCFSVNGSEYPTKAIAVIEALVAKPTKPTKPTKPAKSK